MNDLGSDRDLARVIAQRLDPTSSPVHFSVVVYRVCGNEFGLHADDAAELLEPRLTTIQHALQAQEDDLNDRGLPCSYTFNSSLGYLIQGSLFQDPTTPADVLIARRNRLSHGKIQEFVGSLTPSDFEFVCRGVLDILGCPQPTVTARSKDHGIDFYGKLSLSGRLGNISVLPSLDSGMTIWIAGQAKHFGTRKVGTPDVRELVGSLGLARVGLGSQGQETLAGFRPRFLDPVYALFVASGQFSRDALELMRRSGVIHLDGVALCAFLADNSIGFSEDSDDFSDTLARVWIERYTAH